MDNLTYQGRHLHRPASDFLSNAKLTQTTFLDLVNQINRISNSALLTPQEFGAIGDNLEHPVSDWLTGGTYDRGYADLAAIQADYPHVVALTDQIDWAAIQKACDAALNYGWGVRRALVHIPCGTYRINRTIKLGHEVLLRGEHRAASVIITSTDWDNSQNYWMVEAARGGIDYQHVNGIACLGLDGGLRANGCIWWWNANENGGGFQFELKNFLQVGMRFAKRPGESDPIINFAIQDFHIATTRGEEDCIGIDIQGVNHPLLIEKGTILLRGPSGGPGANGIGIRLNAQNMFICNVNAIHTENCKDGIQCVKGHHVIENCEGWHTVNNVVRIMSSMNNQDDRTLVKGILGTYNLGGGACIQDDSVDVNGGPLRIGRPFFEGSYGSARYKRNGIGLSNRGQSSQAVKPVGDPHEGKFLIGHGFRDVNGNYLRPSYAQISVVSSNNKGICQVEGYTSDNQHAIIAFHNFDGSLKGGAHVFNYDFAY